MSEQQTDKKVGDRVSLRDSYPFLGHQKGQLGTVRMGHMDLGVQFDGAKHGAVTITINGKRAVDLCDKI